MLCSSLGHSGLNFTDDDYRRVQIGKVGKHPVCKLYDGLIHISCQIMEEEGCQIDLLVMMRADLPKQLEHLTVRGIVYDHCIHLDRKSTRLNSSHVAISYAVFCFKKKK